MKQVTVYRLICKNTVEERILNRAQYGCATIADYLVARYKFTIQKTVYAGGFKLQGGSQAPDLTSIFKASELKVRRCWRHRLDVACLVGVVGRTSSWTNRWSSARLRSDSEGRGIVR